MEGWNATRSLPSSRACARPRSAVAMSSMSCHGASRSGIADATPRLSVTREPVAEAGFGMRKGVYAFAQSFSQHHGALLAGTAQDDAELAGRRIAQGNHRADGSCPSASTAMDFKHASAWGLPNQIVVSPEVVHFDHDERTGRRSREARRHSRSRNS